MPHKAKIYDLVETLFHDVASAQEQVVGMSAERLARTAWQNNKKLVAVHEGVITMDRTRRIMKERMVEDELRQAAILAKDKKVSKAHLKRQAALASGCRLFL